MADTTTVQVTVSVLTDVQISFDIKQTIHKILSLKHIDSGSIDFTFVDEAFIIDINTRYLNRTYSTDIVSFNLGTPDNIIGDVYICTEVALKNAKTYSHTIDRELQLLLIHGILHLLDYRDYSSEEKREMTKEQNRILKILTS